jgi:hypothetical protein
MPFERRQECTLTMSKQEALAMGQWRHLGTDMHELVRRNDFWWDMVWIAVSEGTGLFGLRGEPGALPCSKVCR